MQVSEKQFNKKATVDAFDEIYTNFDVAVKDEYLADSGYPFDFPTRWLNDPSMNKRIAIRRLDVVPSSHSFVIGLVSWKDDNEILEDKIEILDRIDITEHDNLIKVLSHMSNMLSVYDNDLEAYKRRLMYEYNEKTNTLKFYVKSVDENAKIKFNFEKTTDDSDLIEFLEFLNQPITDDNINYLQTETEEMVFNNVWSRDRLYIHASFSTSRRKFIGKRGDFYPNMNLLYPLPSNESIFHIYFTSDGKKTILIRYCNFDIQLCYIVNYKTSIVL